MNVSLASILHGADNNHGPKMVHVAIGTKWDWESMESTSMRTLLMPTSNFDCEISIDNYTWKQEGEDFYYQ